VREGSEPRHSSVALALSAIWPGLGEAASGRWRLALLVFLPYTALVVLAATVIALDPAGSALRLLDPGLTLWIELLIGAAFVWRAGSILLVRSLSSATGRSRHVVAVALILAVAAPHALAMNDVALFGAAGMKIFAPEQQIARSPDALAETPVDPGDPEPSVIPGEPGDTVSLVPPLANPDRVTVLFVGVDAAPGRTHALTDSIILASFDPRSSSGVTLSIPRDLAGFPLRDGGRYAGKINSLAAYAARHLDRFPLGGMGSLASEVGYLVGIPVDYYVVVNLPAFQLVVDATGGVDVVNARAIEDPSYHWLDGHYGLSLPAGPLHLDGETALAFVRSRKGAGDSDYTRARRQQQVLLAIRARLLDPAILPRIPEVLRGLEGLVQTNWSPDGLGQAVALASRIDQASLDSVVLGPPYSVHPPMSMTGGSWVLRLDLDKVAALSVRLFGAESRYQG
jgi:LCP family protein required for cell wall assembly